MTIAQTDEPTPEKPLRLWPGVVICDAAVAGQVWRTHGPCPTPWNSPSWADCLGGLAIVVWWAFFSRAPRFERWGALVLTIVALAAAWRLLHTSIATAGMGMLFFIYAIPVLSLAFVVWAVATRRLSDGLRRATMVATILLACGVWTLLRTNGVTGDFNSDLRGVGRRLPRSGSWPKRTRSGCAPIGSGSGGDFRGAGRGQSRQRGEGEPAAAKGRSRLARLSRTRPRQRRPRRADRDRLVCIAAGRAVASAGRTGLVVLCGPRRPPLHPGAAR